MPPGARLLTLRVLTGAGSPRATGNPEGNPSLPASLPWLGCSSGAHLFFEMHGCHPATSDRAEATGHEKEKARRAAEKRAAFILQGCRTEHCESPLSSPVPSTFVLQASEPPPPTGSPHDQATGATASAGSAVSTAVTADASQHLSRQPGRAHAQAASDVPSSVHSGVRDELAGLVRDESETSAPMLRCQQAVRANDLSAVITHVQRHGVHMRGKNGFQALHFAACYGRSEIAEYLLELGADVNAQTARGNSPLHIACFENVIPMVELLVQRGADPALLNWQGKSCMDLVLRAYTIQHLTRALCQRSGGLLNDPSGKLFVHYYQVFGLTVGAGQEQLFPAFKRMLKSIFLKRDVSDQELHMDLHEVCEAYMVLRSSHNRMVFEETFAQCSADPIRIELIEQEHLDIFIKQSTKQMHQAMNSTQNLSVLLSSPPTAAKQDVASPAKDISVAGSASQMTVASVHMPDSPLPNVSPPGQGDLVALEYLRQRRAHEANVLVPSPAPTAMPVVRQRGFHVSDQKFSDAERSAALTFDPYDNLESEQDMKASPGSVTDFSLTQWKTATPRARNLSDLPARKLASMFVNSGSDGFLQAADNTCTTSSLAQNAVSDSCNSQTKCQPCRPRLVPCVEIQQACITDSNMGLSKTSWRPAEDRQPLEEELPLHVRTKQVKCPKVPLPQARILVSPDSEPVSIAASTIKGKIGPACHAVADSNALANNLGQNGDKRVDCASNGVDVLHEDSELGENLQLLAQLKALITKKNAEIASVTHSLAAYSMALSERDSILRQQTKASSARCEQLSQRVASLEAQNAKQAQCVREFQQLLERALTDKICITRNMANLSEFSTQETLGNGASIDSDGCSSKLAQNHKNRLSHHASYVRQGRTLVRVDSTAVPYIDRSPRTPDLPKTIDWDAHGTERENDAQHQQTKTELMYVHNQILADEINHLIGSASSAKNVGRNRHEINGLQATQKITKTENAQDASLGDAAPFWLHSRSPGSASSATRCYGDRSPPTAEVRTTLAVLKGQLASNTNVDRRRPCAALMRSETKVGGDSSLTSSPFESTGISHRSRGGNRKKALADVTNSTKDSGALGGNLDAVGHQRALQWMPPKRVRKDNVGWGGDRKERPSAVPSLFATSPSTKRFPDSPPPQLSRDYNLAGIDSL